MVLPYLLQILFANWQILFVTLSLLLLLFHLVSCVWPFATLWTVAHQAPLSLGFSKQKFWSGLACPPPGDPPDLLLLCLLHCSQIFTIEWQGKLGLSLSYNKLWDTAAATSFLFQHLTQSLQILHWRNIRNVVYFLFLSFFFFFLHFKRS